MKKISNKWLLTVLFVLTALTLSSKIFGQQRQPDRGFHSANSYALSDIETINTTNGNLMLNLPIASLPSGRGGSLGFTLALRYNSKLWDAKQESRTNGIPDDNGNTNYTVELLKPSYESGWNLAMYYNLDVTSRRDLEPPVGCTLDQSLNKNAYIWKVRLQFPDGSYHEFKPVGYSEMFEDGFYNISPSGVVGNVTALSVGGSPSCSYGTTQATTNGMNYVSVDGSAVRLFIPYNSANNGIYNRWTLYFPDGRIIERLPTDDASVAQRITDRNGNKTVFKGGFLNGMSGTKIEDDAGHFIFITHTSDTVNNTWSDTVYQPGVNGELLQTKIDWQELWIYRKYLASLDVNAPLEDRRPELFESAGAVSKITLPSQSGSLTYNFTYNAAQTRPTSGNYTTGWGELNSVTLPSGAKAEYDFSLDGQTDASFITNFDVLNNNVTRKDLKYNSEYDNAITPVTETWTYNINSSTSGSVTGPDGSGSMERFGSGASQGLSYRTERSNGSMVERIWQFNTVQGVAQSSTSGNNSYVKTELSTIPNNAGQPSLTAIKDFKYDKNGNVLEIKEYDWVPFNSIPRQTFGNDPNIGKVTGLPANIQNYLKRTTVNTYYNQASDAGTSGYDANAYTNPGAAKLKNVIKSTEVRNANGTAVSRSEFFYDDASNKGNLTETRSWDSTKQSILQAADANGYKLTNNNYVNSLIVYDVYGNPTLMTDAKGSQTQITYGNITTPNGVISGLYPTQTVAAYGTSIARTSTAAYDFYTGLVTSATDVDNNLTSGTEYDDLGRPTKTKAAIGTPLEIWTQTVYDDINRRVIVKSDVETKGDARKVGTQFYDQLGRVRLSKTLENSQTQSATNETDGIKVQTRYLTTNGYTYQLSSNPYRANYSTDAASETTMGWTRATAVNTGRHSEVETFSGASLPAPWGTNSNSTGKVQSDIDANSKTITDQTGRKRKGLSDALGRMIQVIEDPAGQNLSTGYVFDTTGNLRQTFQGEQNRYFMYDSLGRLLYAKQPEQETNAGFSATDPITNNSEWSVGYRYDNNGNIISTTDARGVSITGTYDALNRLIFRDYSDSTADVIFTYDDAAIPYSKGHLTKVSSSVSETRYSQFDRLGRLTAHQQITDGQTYNTDYQYNLSSLVSETYPSGKTVFYNREQDGDLESVRAQKTNSPAKLYLDQIKYNPAGAVEQARLGNGRWESAVYNSRGQITQIGLGFSNTDKSMLKLDYNYGSNTQNNGTLLQQKINYRGLTNEIKQDYSYDNLNRLKSSTETVSNQIIWKQTYNYDRYGNRVFDSVNTTTLSQAVGSKITNPSINTSDNRLKKDQDGDNVADYDFDKAGNLVLDAENQRFVFDAENRMKEFFHKTNTTGTPDAVYRYDGEGRRVKKITGNRQVIFVYNGSGSLIAEYDTQPTANPQISYLTADQLGSPRVITDGRGAVIARHDYMAYGADITETLGTVGGRTPAQGYVSADQVRQQYTGYEHDDESGLDFAQARYYNASHGRFTSVDPLTASANMKDPQTFNRYSYALNSPYKFTDPLGLIASSANNTNIDQDQCQCRPKRKTTSRQNSERSRANRRTSAASRNAPIKPATASTPQASDNEDIDGGEAVVVGDAKIKEISNKISAELNAGLKRDRLILKRDPFASRSTEIQVEDSYTPIKVGTKEIDINTTGNMPYSGGSNPIDGEQLIDSKALIDIEDNRLETAENVNEIIRNAEVDILDYKGPKGGRIDDEERTRAITTAIEKGINDFNKVRPKR